MPSRFRSFRRSIAYSLRLTWRTKAFWLRAFLCWLVGAAFLINDQSANYDLRFNMRGEQTPTPEIVLINISERDWTNLQDGSRNIIRPLKEITNFTDSFFWNTRTWYHLLGTLLQSEPAAIGVTFYFGENIRLPQMNEAQLKVFEHPKVVWGADLDGDGRALVPSFATTFNSNVGIRTVRRDNDGIVRRFFSPLVHIPHLAVRLAQIQHPDLGNEVTQWEAPKLINYQGPQGTFPQISFDDVLEQRVPAEFFKGKIIIIGTDSAPVDQMLTPVGPMSRSEVLANVTDNLIKQRWIGRLNNGIYLIGLGALVVFSIWILSSYPQSAALVFFIWMGTLIAAISAWIFDTYNFWLPVLSPVLQLGFTYIIFLSYQLSLNEQKTWRLEQEQKYLREIEQLKNNFVSLFSHDLKTPIAKIQAICDRLLSTHPEHEFAVDLKTLRRTSDDLHRYIQSILHVTKVEAKDFKIKKEVTDINENIEKVMQRIAPLAVEKRIHLVQNLEPMFSIEVDTTLIQEVILNLVENAIKYTPEGGTVTITSEEVDDNVRVIIEDTGVGIASEDQKEIWGKFTRGKQANPNVKGTGLGLYLVKYFIELHGGKVFLESVQGQGTKVGFSIPLSDSQETNEIL